MQSETEGVGSTRCANRCTKPILPGQCGAGVGGFRWPLGPRLTLKRIMAGTPQTLNSGDACVGRHPEAAPFVEKQHCQATLLLVVRLSSEWTRQAVRQDCSFATKQESRPALLVVVQLGCLVRAESGSLFPKRQPAAAPSVSAPASAITVRTTLSALPSMTIARIAMGDVGLTRSAWDGCIVRLTAVGVHQLGAS